VTGVLPDEVPFPVLDSEGRSEVKVAASKALHEYADKLRKLSPAKVEEIVSDEFEVSDAIISYAQENDIDAIVLGKHGKGFLATVLVGSVASSVVKHSSIPVLVIPISSGK
ncbi:MAG: universal stress protein, partial [Akkermansia sp.]